MATSNHPAYDYYRSQTMRPVQDGKRIIFRRVGNIPHPVGLAPDGKLYVNNAIVGEAEFHPAKGNIKASCIFIQYG